MEHTSPRKAELHLEGSPAARLSLPKAPTGIEGLDEITGGGLPRGRPTIITGTAGCGKTLLAMEFVVHGAVDYGEPGVFMAFEETAEELTQNVRSLGFDLDQLVADGLLVLDHVRVERNEIEETGEYDLEGLFIRLGYAIDSIGAKRVVLDTVEALFAGLSNHMLLRAELRRLFRWLKEKGVTAVITAERGEGMLTRHGLEEYVSDCVILLEHRTAEQITTRRLRIVKYRGSSHGTNEYPFLIGADGIRLFPITSLKLDHAVSTEFVSTGIPRLDTMLSGKGYYRGSSILISGTAGAGKTSVAAHLADATARRGERCLYFAFEESAPQLIRNMRSIGIDLGRWVEQGLLRLQMERPTFYGLETHLVTIYELVREFQPHVLILDPITNLTDAGSEIDAETALLRLIDFLKSHQITALFTSLTSDGARLEQSEAGVSSLIDTWILLKMIESSGERNRGLYILKSRGMGHSNKIREFQLTAAGLQILDVYTGPGGVLTGTARLAHEARERAASQARLQEVERKQRELAHKRAALEATIASLRAEFQTYEGEVEQLSIETERARAVALDEQRKMAQERGSDVLFESTGSNGPEGLG